MKKIYLAGPTVFLPNAGSVFAEILTTFLSVHGLQGLSPLDAELPADLSGAKAAAWIRSSNIDLLNQADGVVADITSFRGPDMDPGTAWEIGFATCRGLPIEVYSSDFEDYVKRVPRATAAASTDLMNRSIEDFGLRQNLMICGVENQIVHPNWSAAAAAISARLNAGPLAHERFLQSSVGSGDRLDTRYRPGA